MSLSVRIARSTVKEYLDRAAAVGLNWETVAELSEEELDRRLFAAVDTRHWDRPLPDWEAVEKELRGRGCRWQRPEWCGPPRSDIYFSNEQGCSVTAYRIDGANDDPDSGFPLARDALAAVGANSPTDTVSASSAERRGLRR